MEISRTVDQRRQRIAAFIEEHAEQLARQGTVVAMYRHRGGHIVGPYHRLTFRLETVQRSVYLGTNVELIQEVRNVLEELQKPYRERRALMRLKKALRTALTECRADLQQDLARWGLRLQGYEIRGWHTRGPRPPGMPRGQEKE